MYIIYDGGIWGLRIELDNRWTDDVCMGGWIDGWMKDKKEGEEVDIDI